MTKATLIALVAALPLVAQEAPTAPTLPATPDGQPASFPDVLKKVAEMTPPEGEGVIITGLDGKARDIGGAVIEKGGKVRQLTEEEREAMRTRGEEMRKKMLEAFDTNKDGQLDEAEKKAMMPPPDAMPGKGGMQAGKEELEARRAEIAKKIEEAKKAREAELDAKGADITAKRAELEAKRAELEQKVEGAKQAPQKEIDAQKAKVDAAKEDISKKVDEAMQGPKGKQDKRGHWQGPRTKMPRNPMDKARKH